MQELGFKYCPSCGKKSILQTGNHIACEDCNFEFFFNTASACAAIIEYEDKIIATVRKKDPEKGKLDLPGGFVDKFESVEEAIQREVKEELNLEFDSLQYIGSSHNRYPYSGITYHTLDSFFVGRVSSIENIHVEDDISDYKLIPIDKLSPDDFPFVSIKEGLKMYLANRN